MRKLSRNWALVFAALLCVGVLAACGSDDDGGDTGGAAATTPATSTPASTAPASTSGGETPAAQDVGDGCTQFPAPQLPGGESGAALAALNLPDDIEAGFDHYAAPLVKSPFENFKAKSGPPWKVGYSESFSGNPWRQQVQAAVKENFAKAKEMGKVEGDLVFLDSNNNNSVQVQQMRSMLQQGVDIIFTIAGSGTALNGVIKQAYDQGVPVLTIGGAVTTPYAINIDANYYLLGQQMAVGIAQAINGKGDYYMVNGISGTPGSTTYEKAANTIFARCPDMKKIADVYGQWNDATAKTEMLKALSAHPGKIDAIWMQGTMHRGVIQALQQAGRDPSKIAMSSDTYASFLAFWRDNIDKGFKGAGQVAPPHAPTNAAWQVGFRVMEGKGLKLNTIVGNPPLVTNENFKDYVKPEFTFDDINTIVEPPEGTFLNNKALDSFFVTPGAVDYGVNPD